MKEEKCHYCEKITETIECNRCEEPTCEDCFAPMKHYSTDPVTDCLACESDHEYTASIEAREKWDREEKEKAEKEKRNKAARVRYWKPENVAKRKAKKSQQRKERAEHHRKMMQETFKLVNDMMR